MLMFQMLLAYCQLLLGVATLLSQLHLSSPFISTSAAANPGVRLTPRYDPDNESLGPPYDLRVIGNGNHDDSGTTSRRHDDGCHGATAPAEIPVAAADVVMTSDVFCQSNSI